VPAVLELLAGRGAADDRLSLAVNVSDSFYAPNNGRWVVRIEDGRAKVADAGAADVELQLDVATFSSLAVGAVGFARLHGYGLAELSDPDQLAAVDRFFYAPESPRCLTFF
jgi:predicted acetyltransferase